MFASHRPLRALAAAGVAWVSLSCVGAAQTPFEQGISLRMLVPNGLPAPASLARDPATGDLYASSLFDANGSGQPTDIYRILADGTVETFTNPINDPDVLIFHAGKVFVGAAPGKITEIDPVTGDQSRWVKDNTLGNIDGLVFTANGDCLVTAIDKTSIFHVDGITKAITVFADLSALPVQGFGSILIDPADGSVFAATPKDGILVHLASDGTLLDGAYRTGYAHMGQLGIDGDMLYVTDNPVGMVTRIDRVTDTDHPFVFQVPQNAGGFLVTGDGTFYGSWQADDLSDGGIYHVQPYTLAMAVPPQVGGTWELDVDSPADATRLQFTFIGFNTGSIPLPDGRTIPADLSPGTYVKWSGPFDAVGHWDLDFAIPNDPILADLVVYVNSFSLDSGFFGISKAVPVTILP